MVLGFGAAIDREIDWDAVVLGELAQHYGIGPADLFSRTAIQTERDLVACILGYLQGGSGGERRVEEPEVINQFCSRFSGTTSLGGTCVRAASAMERLGQPALVNITYADEQVRGLLSEGCSYLVGEGNDPSYPHLIVQYPAGARVRTDRLELVAPRANRLIFVNDPANERLALSSELKGAVAEADVLLVSGLNAMRSLPQLRQRLAYIEECVRGSQRGTLVFYEDAGFHEPAFAEVVRSQMASLVDVYSLSDEELTQVLGSPVDLLDAVQVLDALRTITAELLVPVLVVHSRHWAVAFGERAQDFAGPLATGVGMATARYAYGDAMSAATMRAMAAAPADTQTSRFVLDITALAGGRLACVPVPALNVASPTTVGLGDTFVGGFLAACAASPRTLTDATRRAS